MSHLQNKTTIYRWIVICTITCKCCTSSPCTSGHYSLETLPGEDWANILSGQGREPGTEMESMVTGSGTGSEVWWCCWGWRTLDCKVVAQICRQEHCHCRWVVWKLPGHRGSSQMEICYHRCRCQILRSWWAAELGFLSCTCTRRTKQYCFTIFYWISSIYWRLKYVVSSFSFPSIFLCQIFLILLPFVHQDL